eukprot:201382_1
MSNIQERLDRQLLNACRYGQVSEVDILLSKGANIKYSDEDDPFGATCLSEAARRGKAEIVQLLIDRGMSVNDKISHDITALHLACERGHISVVRVLLKNQCEPCPSELFNLDSPLHYAAANDHSEICALLVEEGHVNVNVQNRTGDTPLHVAVANDRLNSTRQLLALNGDLSITNHAEMTPVVVGQIAKCKHAIEAMHPFIHKLAETEQMEKNKLQRQRTQTRKNTVKKSLETDTNDVDEEYKSMESHALPDPRMSSKRDVVFKKGFMQKQGKKFKHFHDRYFILWSNGFMNYYSKEHTLFTNYAEKSKQGVGGNLNAPSNLTDDQESGDEAPAKPTKSTTKKRKKRKAKTHIKRKSTLHKLGLKSDVIKAKGIIDINDLIETQFLEFSDGNGSGWALITPEREWKFKCRDDKERREWIAAVHAVNYGISPFDIKNLGMNISYKHNTMLLEPSTNAFVSGGDPNAVASGWMFKLGAAPKGLEQNYWKKRWVSLYKKPARLAYAQHPHGTSDGPEVTADPVNDDGTEQVSADGKLKVGKNSVLKGVIELNEVNNIIKIGDNDIIKKEYKAPTVHVFALITEKRTWVFATKTAEECTMWHDRISFFLPNQWKMNNENVNIEELLRLNRVKTIVNDLDTDDSEDESKDQHLAVKKRKKKKKGDDGMMSKLFRKVSNVAETLGITEQYSTISEVQPRGTMQDYEEATEALEQIEKQHSIHDDDHKQEANDNAKANDPDKLEL